MFVFNETAASGVLALLWRPPASTVWWEINLINYFRGFTETGRARCLEEWQGSTETTTIGKEGKKRIWFYGPLAGSRRRRPRVLRWRKGSVVWFTCNYFQVCRCCKKKSHTIKSHYKIWMLNVPDATIASWHSIFLFMVTVFGHFLTFIAFFVG